MLYPFLEVSGDSHSSGASDVITSMSFDPMPSIHMRISCPQGSSHTLDSNTPELQELSSAFGSTFLLITGVAVAEALVSIALRKPRLKPDYNREEDTPDLLD
jgi:hypothetical protein